MDGVLIREYTGLIFNHSKVTLDDGLEVLVIDMDWVPDAGWDSE